MRVTICRLVLACFNKGKEIVVYSIDVSYSVFIYHLSDSLDFDGVVKMEEKGFAEYAGNCVSLSGKFSLNFPIDQFPY